MRILLIEDEKSIAREFKRALKDSYVVDVIGRGIDGEYLVQVNDYALVVIDSVLPDSDGITVCKKLRSAGVKTPILMLAEKEDIDRKVEALDVGADDCLDKPVSIKEFLARLRALMRRNVEEFIPNVLKVDGLSLDFITKTVKYRKNVISLRKKEFNLLEYLMRHPGQVLTREMIFEHVWDSESEMMENTINVHVKHLRDRIDRTFGINLIKTVHGLGYKIEAK